MCWLSRKHLASEPRAKHMQGRMASGTAPQQTYKMGGASEHAQRKISFHMNRAPTNPWNKATSLAHPPFRRKSSACFRDEHTPPGGPEITRCGAGAAASCPQQ